MNKLLILSADAEQYFTLIKSADLPQLEIKSTGDVTLAKSLIADCNIVLGDPSLVADVLDSADRLEWVQSSWAGVDQLCKPGQRRDYILTTARGIFGFLISEYVTAYLFALERDLFRMRRNQLEQNWKPLAYRPASDIRLGIVGLGSIGRQLALTARHFGMRVTGLNRSGKPCEEVDRVYTADDIAGFLKNLDYVVLTLPATRDTHHFIRSDTLKLMKSSAVLINVGRGNSVNETDLVRALEEGLIGGAVLDVFESEPLATDSPLWTIPNAYITPHMAATTFPDEIAGIFTGNYKRFLHKQSLQHQVDFELGY